MEFEIKLDYTIEDFDAYWRSFIWKKPESPARKPASSREQRILGLVFLAVCLPTAALLHPLMGVVELAAGVLLLVLSFYTARPRPQSCSRWAKRMWKMYQASEQLYKCCFTEDSCWLHGSKSDHRYDYNILVDLWEDSERFYMVLPGNQIYILRKNAFDQGEPENLPSFWETRTGKPVRQVL